MYGPRWFPVKYWSWSYDGQCTKNPCTSVYMSRITARSCRRLAATVVDILKIHRPRKQGKFFSIIWRISCLNSYCFRYFLVLVFPKKVGKVWAKQPKSVWMSSIGLQNKQRHWHAAYRLPSCQTALLQQQWS